MKPQLGIQLYTVRNHIKTYEDCDKTFAYLAGIGVKVVQISGIGPIPQPQVKELVEKYGFDICVTHTSFDNMLSNVQTVIDNHKMINCDCMGIGGMPSEYKQSAEAVRSFIRLAEPVGKAMFERGCHFAYHNHKDEFKEVEDGKTVMDILIGESNPDYLWFVPDVAWMDVAGVSVDEYLEKMKERVKVLHFKDYKQKEEHQTFTELGKGCVDLEACYRACVRLNIPYIVFEQDNGWADDDALKSCAESFLYMQKIAEKY